MTIPLARLCSVYCWLKSTPEPDLPMGKKKKNNNNKSINGKARSSTQKQ